MMQNALLSMASRGVTVAKGMMAYAREKAGGSRSRQQYNSGMSNNTTLPQTRPVKKVGGGLGYTEIYTCIIPERWRNQSAREKGGRVVASRD